MKILTWDQPLVGQTDYYIKVMLPKLVGLYQTESEKKKKPTSSYRKYVAPILTLSPLATGPNPCSVKATGIMKSSTSGSPAESSILWKSYPLGRLQDQWIEQRQPLRQPEFWPIGRFKWQKLKDDFYW
jgi:hypothetical protein